jgi:hypothetical protein
MVNAGRFALISGKGAQTQETRDEFFEQIREKIRDDGMRAGVGLRASVGRRGCICVGHHEIQPEECVQQDPKYTSHILQETFQIAAWKALAKDG